MFSFIADKNLLFQTETYCYEVNNTTKYHTE